VKVEAFSQSVGGSVLSVTVEARGGSAVADAFDRFRGLRMGRCTDSRPVGASLEAAKVGCNVAACSGRVPCRNPTIGLAWPVAVAVGRRDWSHWSEPRWPLERSLEAPQRGRWGMTRELPFAGCQTASGPVPAPTATYVLYLGLARGPTHWLDGLPCPLDSRRGRDVGWTGCEWVGGGGRRPGSSQTSCSRAQRPPSHRMPLDPPSVSSPVGLRATTTTTYLAHHHRPPVYHHPTHLLSRR